MTAIENLTNVSNEELIEHILNRFHDTHREQLPELIHMAERVERVHSGHPECPAGLASHLIDMQQELESHMAKEEQILFPMITRGMLGMAAAPVSVMRSEHDEHSQALERLRGLARNFTLPEGACGTWQRLYRGLATFQDDLLEHIRTENDLLFCRVDSAA